MVLEKATEERKRAMLQKVVQFTEEVISTEGDREDRPSEEILRGLREGLESIRKASEGIPFQELSCPSFLSQILFDHF